MFKKNNLILIIALGIGTFCLIGAFIFGYGAGASDAVNHDVNDNEEPTEEPIEEVKKDEGPVPEHKDHKEDKAPEVIETTKKIAEDFAIQIETLDPEKPEDYLNHIKDITHINVYSTLKNSPRRPTAHTHKRIVKEVKAFPVDDELANRKQWNVITISDVYNVEGEKRTEENSYWLSVAKDNEEWKVTGIRMAP